MRAIRFSSSLPLAGPRHFNNLPTQFGGEHPPHAHLPQSRQSKDQPCHGNRKAVMGLPERHGKSLAGHTAPRNPTEGHPALWPAVTRREEREADILLSCRADCGRYLRMIRVAVLGNCQQTKLLIQEQFSKLIIGDDIPSHSQTLAFSYCNRTPRVSHIFVFCPASRMARQGHQKPL